MADPAWRGRPYDDYRLLTENEAFAQREPLEILDQMQDIAEGSEVAYRDLLLLNLPLYFVGILLPLECSQILVAPSTTVDGSTHLAKTRDLSHGHINHMVLHRQLAGGCAMMEVGAAGSITWPGSDINSDGLALSISGVWSKRTVLDMTVVSRGWLFTNGRLLLRDSRSVDELAERLSARPRVEGMYSVAADRRAAAAFEATADHVYRQDAGDGMLVRTNHYLTPEIRHLAATPRGVPLHLPSVPGGHGPPPPTPRQAGFLVSRRFPGRPRRIPTVVSRPPRLHGRGGRHDMRFHRQLTGGDLMGSPG